MVDMYSKFLMYICLQTSKSRVDYAKLFNYPTICFSFFSTRYKVTNLYFSDKTTCLHFLHEPITILYTVLWLHVAMWCHVIIT